MRRVLTGWTSRDALLLLAVLAVLPLLPNQPVDPWQVLNLRKLWLLGILVMAIGAAGQMAQQWFGARTGLLLAGFAGGFASSSATIAGLGVQARQQPALASVCAGQVYADWWVPSNDTTGRSSGTRTLASCNARSRLASGMAAHAGVSRLMYVMGRDGVFPTRFFGYVHPKWRTPAWNVLLVGAIALLAIKFDLVTATALINFGALVAFTFVNLSVISQFWIREKRNKTLKDHFNYLILPVCGALTVGALWINLEESSMVLGLIWGGIGLVYLACVTKSFRNPVPQYEDVA